MPFMTFYSRGKKNLPLKSSVQAQGPQDNKECGKEKNIKLKNYYPRKITVKHTLDAWILIRKIQ
jgi:hypothetical protein